MDLRECGRQKCSLSIPNAFNICFARNEKSQRTHFILAKMFKRFIVDRKNCDVKIRLCEISLYFKTFHFFDGARASAARCYACQMSYSFQNNRNIANKNRKYSLLFG